MEWLRKAEEKLDEYGMPAWLAAMVLGFIVFVPIGLVILGYMLWSGRMGCWGKGRSHRSWSRKRGAGTGNTAFDEYREETMRRLEEERDAFKSFLDRLRQAKDKAEFDQFMRERTAQPQAAPATNDPNTGGFGGPAPQPAG
ncbi:MAG: DUF2852 domain-containing protein [Pseudomonadota bacterium]